MGAEITFQAVEDEGYRRTDVVWDLAPGEIDEIAVSKFDPLPSQAEGWSSPAELRPECLQMGVA